MFWKHEIECFENEETLPLDKIKFFFILFLAFHPSLFLHFSLYSTHSILHFVLSSLFLTKNFACSAFLIFTYFNICLIQNMITFFDYKHAHAHCVCMCVCVCVFLTVQKNTFIFHLYDIAHASIYIIKFVFPGCPNYRWHKHGLSVCMLNLSVESVSCLGFLSVLD